jgi:hypothetical protein
MEEARRRKLAAAAGGKTPQQLAVERLDAVEAARPPGVDPIAWLKAHRLPDDGSKDFVPFDPAAVRIERGRIKLPGIPGWVRAGLAPLPPRERLTAVRARMDPDGWSVEVETATED